MNGVEQVINHPFKAQSVGSDICSVCSRYESDIIHNGYESVPANAEVYARASCKACSNQWDIYPEPEDTSTLHVTTCPNCNSGLVSWILLAKPNDQQYEEINHPKHYNSHPSGIECIDVIEHFSFPIGNVIKHLWRAGLKPGMEHHKDLLKAHWYLTRELQRIEREARGNPEGIAISEEMHDKGILDLYGGAR